VGAQKGKKGGRIQKPSELKRKKVSMPVAEHGVQALKKFGDRTEKGLQDWDPCTKERIAGSAGEKKTKNRKRSFLEKKGPGRRNEENFQERKRVWAKRGPRLSGWAEKQKKGGGGGT